MDVLLDNHKKGVTVMDRVREGLIPAVLGTAVTAAGYAMKQNRRTNNMLSDTIVGFGLAHIVLGAIDLVEHRNQY